MDCEDFSLRFIAIILFGIVTFSLSVFIATGINNYVNCRNEGCSKLHCYANICNEDGYCFVEDREELK